MTRRKHLSEDIGLTTLQQLETQEAFEAQQASRPLTSKMAQFSVPQRHSKSALQPIPSKNET